MHLRYWIIEAKWYLISTIQQGGPLGLDIGDFKNVFKSVLGIEKADRQIERLFMKIDTSSDGYIDWDEFCSYMQLEYAEKEAVYRRGMQINFALPVSKFAYIWEVDSSVWILQIITIHFSPSNLAVSIATKFVA